MTYPDFIIGGAMKGGTSSLREVLRRHSDVYIPQGEIHFFAADELDQEGEYYLHLDKSWWGAGVDDQRRLNLDWYKKQFAPASDRQLIGEDSTSYLGSRNAPNRIAEALPHVKLVFSLRDPVDRMYSHYWHRVRTGRATRTFEDVVERRPGNMFRWSLYDECLAPYFDAFDRDQIHIVVFEEFVEHPRRVVDNLCDFLGLEKSVSNARTHSNRSTLPISPDVQRAANHLRQLLPPMSFVEHIPDLPDGTPEMWDEMSSTDIFFHVMAAGLERLLDQLPQNDYPPMASETRSFLQEVFTRELDGLEDLVGRDFSSFWPWL